ncbi:MAG: hypothetical protein LBM93_09990 [Oscillospiraceae bacterium]|jgi:hypothetical protein|nr:hypothetical protein [Oscillospiraceae bacterium]
MKKSLFKFLSRVAHTALSAGDAYISGDYVTFCIDSAIKLIDTASDIVVYVQTAKRTEILDDMYTKSIAHYRELYNFEVKSSEAEIQYTQEMLEQRLKNNREKLSQLKSNYIDEILTDSAKYADSILEYENKRCEIYGKLRNDLYYTLVDIVGVIYIYQLSENCDPIKSNEIEEQFRTVASQYKSFLKKEIGEV